jgi:radical SAM superfamily enzyme YgiQ (UPF0313 family)
MKILLLEPAEGLRYSNFAIPQLGLAYLAARLLEARHEVRVFHAALARDPRKELLAEVDAFQPEVVGFSAPTSKVMTAGDLAADIKQTAPHVKTIVGGWHVTALPRETLASFPAFDFGFVGEAEDYILTLLGALQNGDGLEDVPGLVWRRDGEIAANPPGKPTDLQTLPRPAWHLFPMDRFAPMYRAHGRDYPMMSGRGCPFRCSFCQRVTGAVVRTRDINDVVDELFAGTERWQADGVQFLDETFTVNAHRTNALCELLIERGVPGRLIWNCTSRVDTISRVILLGMESGNQHVLEGVCKNTTLQQGLSAVRWCREIGLLTDVSFVLGLPRDNRHTVRETVAFSRRLDPDFVSYFSFVPFPGTEGGRLAEEGRENLRLLHRDWSRYQPQLSPTCELLDFSARRLVALRYRAYLRFYLRPRKFFNLLAMFRPRSMLRVFARLVGDLAGRGPRSERGKRYPNKFHFVRLR